ncbi:MAG: hypothetical protein M1817_003930 [Caeruleum heppii]|nr:MAG: hypothetical protein M1817_003930 [Caeruleum heppii]
MRPITIILLVLPFLFSLFPLVTATIPAAGPFSLLAVRSASPLHYRPIAAAGRAFYIGRPTSAYCPSPPVSAEACPVGNETILIQNGDSLAMSVSVPGGQRAYIGPSGALSYTGPHSGSIPAGSLQTGFGTRYGTPLPALEFRAQGFLACPVVGAEGVYQVFANVPVAERQGCLPFVALEVPAAATVGAWEYT